MPVIGQESHQVVMLGGYTAGNSKSLGAKVEGSKPEDKDSL